MRLRFTRSSSRDLTRLRNFIARHDPRAAARVSRRLGRTIRLLRDQPGLRQAVDELPGVGELVAGDYLVRHTVRDECVADTLVLRHEYRRAA